MSSALATKASYRKFRNFSRNRPETTNLNHLYAFRRIFIVLPSMLTVARPHRE
jgi:hypothetical protein